MSERPSDARRGWRVRKGQKVRVVIAGELLVGTYLGRAFVKVRDWPNGGFRCPRLRVGRRIVYGFQCWWLPLSVALKQEALRA